MSAKVIHIYMYVYACIERMKRKREERKVGSHFNIRSSNIQEMNARRTAEAKKHGEEMNSSIKREILEGKLRLENIKYCVLLMV